MQLFGHALKYYSALLRLGGLGSVLGGVLWGLLVVAVLLQMLGIMHFYDVLPPPCCDVRQPYDLNIPILAVPILLLLPGLVGLFAYAHQHFAFNRAGKMSALLTLVGIVMILANIAGKYWVWWLGGYGGWADLHFLPPADLLWFLWYASFGPGIVVLASGLTLFGFSIVRRRVLSTWSVLLLILASLPMSLIPIQARFQVRVDAVTN